MFLLGVQLGFQMGLKVPQGWLHRAEGKQGTFFKFHVALSKNAGKLLQIECLKSNYVNIGNCGTPFADKTGLGSHSTKRETRIQDPESMAAISPRYRGQLVL
jgi:hypothetical protein